MTEHGNKFGTGSITGYINENGLLGSGYIHNGQQKGYGTHFNLFLHLIAGKKSNYVVVEMSISYLGDFHLVGFEYRKRWWLGTKNL